MPFYPSLYFSLTIRSSVSVCLPLHYISFLTVKLSACPPPSLSLPFLSSPSLSFIHSFIFVTAPTFPPFFFLPFFPLSSVLWSDS